jgi:two-component system, OmpR family, KDP operon response regulator KdpE
MAELSAPLLRAPARRVRQVVAGEALAPSCGIVDAVAHALVSHATMTTDPTRLLAVDDEPQITRVLRAALASQGYQVRTATDGETALASFAEWKPHLVVSDLRMPHMDGLELCRKIRAVSKVPIIVLSVDTSERSKVQALDAGADDYITKPFGADELLARIRAVTRRARDEESSELAPIDVGDVRIDVAARRVHVAGRVVRLTPKEFDLLLYLARRPNRVVEHHELLEAIWGEGSREHNEYLRVFVGQLRKKLEPEPWAPRYIETEPWVGYRFNPAKAIAR